MVWARLGSFSRLSVAERRPSFGHLNCDFHWEKINSMSVLCSAVRPDGAVAMVEYYMKRQSVFAPMELLVTPMTIHRAREAVRQPRIDSWLSRVRLLAVLSTGNVSKEATVDTAGVPPAASGSTAKTY